jgi:hypothetical protein
MEMEMEMDRGAEIARATEMLQNSPLRSIHGRLG